MEQYRLIYVINALTFSKNEKEMTSHQYNKSKEILYDIWYLNPSADQITKYLNLMYQSLCEDRGFLSKKEILAKIVNDTTTLGLSKTKMKQLLLWEKN